MKKHAHNPLALILPLLALVSCAAPMCGETPAPKPAPPPTADAPTPDGPTSVLFVTLDTTRQDHLGAYGSTLGLTPNIDAVAEQGVVFENAYTQVPITLPSHVAMLTGMDILEHGVHENGTFVLGDDVTTLPEVFAAEGYQTGGFVSTAVLGRKYGVAQGFQTFNDEMTRWKRQVTAGGDKTFFERTADKTNAAAQEWLDTLDTQRPFFMWVHYYDPHGPYRAPRRLRDKFKHPYAAEIAFMDEQFGLLLEAARAKNPRLLVVIASDHGEHFGDHGLSGHGKDLFEGAMRTVLIFSGHKSIAPHTRVPDHGVASFDLGRTTLDTLGIKRPFPGKNLLADDGKLKGRNPLYLETLLPALREKQSPVRGVLAMPWKLITEPDDDLVVLYNLRFDPRENQDRAPNHAARRKSMLEALQTHIDAHPTASPHSSTIVLDEDTEEELRALGYIDGDDDEDAPGPPEKKP